MVNDTIRCEICNKDFSSQEAIDSHNRAKHETAQKSKSHKFPIKTVSIIGIFVVVILGVVAFSVAGHKSSNIDSNVVADSGSAQTATLSVSDATYILEPSTFKKDVPVNIIANVGSMPGCSKAVTIPAFGVLKYVSVQDNIITFTPTKTGTFKIACSMNMYTGTFTVE